MNSSGNLVRRSAVKGLMDSNTRRKIKFLKGQERISELASALFEDEIATFLIAECAKNRDKKELAAAWSLPHDLPPSLKVLAVPMQLSM